MRIFNGKDAQISLPLGTVRLEIPSKAVSKDFAPNPDFLSLIVTAYTRKDIALIVSGPFELSMCSTIPPVTDLIVQTLEEAIERFTPKKEEEKPVVVEKENEEITKKEEEIVVKEEEKKEEPVVEVPEPIQGLLEEKQETVAPSFKKGGKKNKK